MRTIFEKVREKLLEIPAIKWIDLDKGQLDDYQGKPPVDFPCVLIDVIYPRTEDEVESGSLQLCDATVNIRLAYDYTGDTHGHVSADHLNDSLAYFDTVKSIYDKLQGYSETGANGFQNLKRTAQRTERRPDRYKVINIPFATITRETNS